MQVSDNALRYPPPSPNFFVFFSTLTFFLIPRPFFLLLLSAVAVTAQETQLTEDQRVWRDKRNSDYKFKTVYSVGDSFGVYKGIFYFYEDARVLQWSCAAMLQGAF